MEVGADPEPMLSQCCSALGAETISKRLVLSRPGFKAYTSQMDLRHFVISVGILLAGCGCCTKYRELGGFNNRNIFSQSSVGPKSGIKDWFLLRAPRHDNVIPSRVFTSVCSVHSLCADLCPYFLFLCLFLVVSLE